MSGCYSILAPKTRCVGVHCIINSSISVDDAFERAFQNVHGDHLEVLAPRRSVCSNYNATSPHTSSHSRPRSKISCFLAPKRGCCLRVVIAKRMSSNRRRLAPKIDISICARCVHVYVLSYVCVYVLLQK